MYDTSKTLKTVKAINSFSIMAEFKEWQKSDNVIRDENGFYRTQCMQYSLPMNETDLLKYFIREYVND